MSSFSSSTNFMFFEDSFVTILSELKTSMTEKNTQREQEQLQEPGTSCRSKLHEQNSILLAFGTGIKERVPSSQGTRLREHIPAMEQEQLQERCM